jgi:hypothetical protein
MLDMALMVVVVVIVMCVVVFMGITKGGVCLVTDF